MKRRKYLSVLASSPLLSSISAPSEKDRVRSVCNLYGVEIDSIDTNFDHLDYLIRLDYTDHFAYFDRIQKRTDSHGVMINLGKVRFFAGSLREACRLVSHMSSEYLIEALDKDGYHMYIVFANEGDWSYQLGYKKGERDDVYFSDFSEENTHIGYTLEVYSSGVRPRVWREYYET